MGKKNIAVFMDRDGTLCEDVGYLDDPRSLRFFPGVFKAIKRLNRMGVKAVIVTNQSGIGRGFFSERTVLDIHDRLTVLLNEKGASVDNIYYCPHHPDDGCGCRKPMPGLLKKASMDMAIDLNASYMVGDQTTDIELAYGVGAKGVLVMTGFGLQSLKELELKSVKPHHVSRDIGEAVDWIVKDMGK